MKRSAFLKGGSPNRDSLILAIICHLRAVAGPASLFTSAFCLRTTGRRCRAHLGQNIPWVGRAFVPVHSRPSRNIGHTFQPRDFGSNPAAAFGYKSTHRYVGPARNPATGTGSPASAIGQVQRWSHRRSEIQEVSRPQALDQQMRPLKRNESHVRASTARAAAVHLPK